ncbi:MAG: hypothetical protein F6K36_04750 [Symploca sp. SIO3C6]|nr:hypothetical protein [Symploca sp. SIO3C6]
MNKLSELINSEQSRLSLNPLNLLLMNTTVPFEKKISCIYRMTFFILGFKDIMLLMRYQSPASDLELMINQHSEEDSQHWHWFLKDLRRLNINDKFGKDVTQAFAQMWSQDHFPIRNMVYKIMYYLQQYNHPAFRLLIVIVLESGFNTLIEVMHPVLKKAGMYEKLEFFGQVHKDAESNHQAGSYFDAEEHYCELLSLCVNHLSEAEYLEAKAMVKVLFSDLYAMHECFAKPMLESSLISVN